MWQRKGKRKFRFRRPNGKRNHNPTAGSSSSSSATPPPWIELPRDVTANILRRLAPEEILDAAERVCSTWRSVCREPSFWRVIHMKYSDDLDTEGLADSMCRRAVDRSQGELINISIQEFATDDLLRYISERSSHLKTLSLESCEDISPGGLTAAVKNFPHLEELHLFFFPLIISDSDIKTIGISCPMLKSFTFNDHSWYEEEEDTYDSLTLSIGKNMPNLRRLRLVGNRMSNKGLLAILDGCPNLELLDLLHCCNVDLECDDLGRRCSEQVKKLRLPFDSTAGCEWDARVYDKEDGYDDYDDYSDNSYDGYSDISMGYGMGCYSDYGDDWFYDPFSDPAEFMWDNGF